MLTAASSDGGAQERTCTEVRILALEGQQPPGVTFPFGSFDSHGIVINNEHDVAFSDGDAVFTYDVPSEQAFETERARDTAPGETMGVLAFGAVCSGHPCAWLIDQTVLCCACVECTACFGKWGVEHEDCANPYPADFKVTGMSLGGLVLFEGDAIRTCLPPPPICERWEPTFAHRGIFTRSKSQTDVVFCPCGLQSCDGAQCSSTSMMGVRRG